MRRIRPTWCALRDSEIIAVPKEIFLEACEADTAVMIELAKLMMLRSRQAAPAAELASRPCSASCR
jgi:NTE family protein